MNLTYDDSALPGWLDPILQSLPDRWGSTPGWNGYQAVPTSAHLVITLLNTLLDVMRRDFRPPQMVPLADGGMQAEWHNPLGDLEIVVPADEPPAYYFFDVGTGQEEEGVLSDSESRVTELIRKFR